MKNLKYLLMALMLGLSVPMVACTATTGDDDDDATPPPDDDDDDSTPDDDDDTTGGLEINSLTFNATFTVIAGDGGDGGAADAADDDDSAAGDDDDSAAGDDDDSATGDDDDAADDDDSATGDDDDAADDDDSAGDDDDAADDDDSAQPPEGYSVVANFSFTYWRDIQNQIEECEQVIQIEGTADFGFGVMQGECNNCTGRLTFDPTTGVDISDPANGECDVAVLDANGANFGALLLSPTSDEAYGDFLDLALIDAATHTQLGTDWAVNTGLDAAGIQEGLDQFALTYTHTGFTNNVEGTLGNGSGLEGVANNAGGNSTWFAYWQLFKNPEINPHEGIDMNGDYGGSAFFLINFQPQ